MKMRIGVWLVAAVFATGFAASPRVAAAAPVKFTGSPASYRAEMWVIAQSTADLIQEYWQDEQNDWPGDCGSCDPTDQSVSDMEGIQRSGLATYRQMQGVQARYQVYSGDRGIYTQPLFKLGWALQHLDSAVVATGNNGYGDGDDEAQMAERSLAGAWRALKKIR